LISTVMIMPSAETGGYNYDQRRRGYQARFSSKLECSGFSGHVFILPCQVARVCCAFILRLSYLLCQSVDLRLLYCFGSNMKKPKELVNDTVDRDWGAPIVSFQEFAKLRPKLGKVVATSGGFDPIHPGHISCIIDSKKYGDTLVVIVNGDAFLTAKKGRPFQNLETRCLIVSGIVGVDYVIPFEIHGDQTVAKALEALKPDVFTKGGDRLAKAHLPEAEQAAIDKYKIKTVYGVGEDKKWSSSWFLKEWDEGNGKT